MAKKSDPGAAQQPGTAPAPMAAPTRRTPSRRILFVSSEAVPFIKTGGLGDVCGALPHALRERGHDVRLILPLYRDTKMKDVRVVTSLGSMGVPMGGGATLWCRVLGAQVGRTNLPVYFIEYADLFDRPGVYNDNGRDYIDNPARFGFFSRAALQFARDSGFVPHVVHCHDWPTALVPAYLRLLPRASYPFARTASVLTIHNVMYHGRYPTDQLPFLGLQEIFREGVLAQDGWMNFLQAGIFLADAVTTVSPTYAKEIRTAELGGTMAPLLNRRAGRLVGILNGVDYHVWDPGADTFIPARFTPENQAGKAECKRVLQRTFLLDENPEIPVIGMVCRFSYQKGVDLVVSALHRMMSELRAQFVFLGSGEEKDLENLVARLPMLFRGRIGSFVGYNDPLAHLIEAGSDFFLMPSRFEPCGLNQLYSLRYGTLPIVRDTGGLSDTVEQYDQRTGEGTGFKFLLPTSDAIAGTVSWAVDTWYKRRAHIQAMRTRAMTRHFSWDDSAETYESLYERLIAETAG